MSYLLDTNICIAALNGRPASTIERIADAIAQDNVIAVSAITVFELQYGVFKNARVEGNTRALHTFLRPLLILGFDELDARHAGVTRVALERKGRPIGPYDYLIAAQAVRHGFVLITANMKEFSRIADLRCENWIA